MVFAGVAGRHRFIPVWHQLTLQILLLHGFDYLDFYLAGNMTTPKMRILDNGNVGIGATASDALLSVNGAADKPGGGSWTSTPS